MVKKVLVDGHYGAVSLNIGALLDGRNDLEVICLEDKTAFTPEQRVNLLNTADIVILCQSAQTVTETLPLIKNSATKVLDTSNAYRLAPSWAYGLPPQNRCFEIYRTSGSHIDRGFAYTESACQGEDRAAVPSFNNTVGGGIFKRRNQHDKYV